MRLTLALAALAAVSLAACNRPAEKTPQGSDVAAAMPDTNADRAADRPMTAPDAGATGAVPANGAPPAVGAPGPASPPAK